MNRRYTLAIATRILQQFRHDRRTLALLFVAPLLILTLLALLIRGGTNSPRIDVVDLDRGPVAVTVVDALDRAPGVVVANTDLPTATAALAGNDIAAFVVIPDGFSSEVISQGRIGLQIHLEGSQPSLNQPVILAVTQASSSGVAAVASRQGIRVPSFAPDIAYLHGGPNLDSLDYFAAVQAIVVLVFTLYVLHVQNAGSVPLVVLLALLMTLGAVNLGVLLSMFARTEFQAVQFIPIVIVPQFLLSGVLFPVASEPGWLQIISDVLPLTYGVSGLRDVMLRGASIGSAAIEVDLAVLVAFVVLLIVGAALTLRREVA